MNIYILVLILGIYAHMPWWFWVLFTILCLDEGYVGYKNSKQ